MLSIAERFGHDVDPKYHYEPCTKKKAPEEPLPR
jgi:hypothetical protein